MSAVDPKGGATVAKNRGALPGFGLSFGITLTYLALIVLIPLAALAWRTTALSAHELVAAVLSPRALAAYRLSFGAAAAAATVNAVFGLILAWVLVRYEFPGHGLIDAMVDLPFALPTAVAGIALTSLFAENGWLGRWLEPHGIKIAFAPAGIAVAMTFVGLPFVVRAVQPILIDIDPNMEEVAATLGASRLETVRRVMFPAVLPGLLTGFTLAFARGLGEYGSIVFISGNMPMRTEIVPLLIVTKLEQYDYAGATAIALFMLAASFALMLVINLLQGLIQRRGGRA
ncbi:MAG TPA: sulfate ABC transporter permease subunit CysT [Polyangia bacterium]|jgi:sulfate transport system permease protein|nr:sulfate ABC transporter permease subunit CysT [Polyangia bacterium]